MHKVDYIRRNGALYNWYDLEKSNLCGTQFCSMVLAYHFNLRLRNQNSVL